jgi:hypothetical protein
MQHVAMGEEWQLHKCNVTVREKSELRKVERCVLMAAAQYRPRLALFP